MATIIMIDDEPEFLVSHAEALEDEGHKVNRKSNLGEALHFIKSDSVDLIVLDLLMPTKEWKSRDLRRTGLLLHQKIRVELGLTTIPIIFMSVVRDDHLRNSVIAAEQKYFDNVQFLSKPVRINELIAAVKQCLEE